MKTHRKFIYTTPRRLTGWGFRFDSFTEVKYAISIMDDYVFQREAISIYFHPGSLILSARARPGYLRYTPDFLIRHRDTHEAFLVEIKPRAFEHHRQLAQRKQLAENYIRWKKYDWQFKVVFDDQIILSAQQLSDFETCRTMTSNTALRQWFSEYYHRIIHYSPGHPAMLKENKRLQYLIHGIKQLLIDRNW